MYTLKTYINWIHINIVCVLLQIKKPTYFTIQLIFATIHKSIALFGITYGFHYTISANLLPLSIVLLTKNFQF